VRGRQVWHSGPAVCSCNPWCNRMAGALHSGVKGVHAELLTESSRHGWWRARVVEVLALVLLNGHQTCERGCALNNMSAGKASKASEGWRRWRCGGRRGRRTGAQPAWRACAATSRRHRTTERRQGQVELEIRQGRNKSWCDHSELPLEHPTTMTPGTTSLWALGRPLTYWPE
jgi:hypothetical protein